MTAEEFIARIDEFCVDLGVSGRDPSFGWGMLDALLAVQGAEPPFGTPVWAVDKSVRGSRRIVSRTFDLGDGSEPIDIVPGETKMLRAKIGGSLTTVQTVTDTLGRSSTSTEVVDVPEPPPEQGPTSFHEVLLVPPTGGEPAPQPPGELVADFTAVSP